MSVPTLHSVRWFSGLLLSCIMLVGIAIADSSRGLAFGMSACMLLAGVPPFVYGLASMERYKNVFDYEPTQLWGKPNNGMGARWALMSISVIGLSSVITGAGLLTFLLFW